MLPPFVRRLVPLSWWPSFCAEQQKFYDFVIDEFVTPHELEWKPDENVTCLIDAIRQDVHDGRLTHTDLIHMVMQEKG